MRPLTALLTSGVVGLVTQVTGLVVDATLHTHDPGLAVRESVLTLTNPGHLLMALGLALTGVSLVGALLVHLSRPGRISRRILATGSVTSLAVVILAMGAVMARADAQHVAPHDHGSTPHTESDRIARELGARVADHHGEDPLR